MNETSPIATDGLHSRRSRGTSTLRSGQEGEHDPGERRDKDQPLLRLGVEDVADEHPTEQLQDRDRHTRVNGDHAREQDDDREQRSESERTHTPNLLA